MRVNGALSDHQLLGNLAIGQPMRHQNGYFGLTSSQLLRPARRRVERLQASVAARRLDRRA